MDLGSFYLCRVTIMVAGSLVDQILDLEIRSVNTAPLHDQDRRVMLLVPLLGVGMTLKT